MTDLDQGLADDLVATADRHGHHARTIHFDDYPHPTVAVSPYPNPFTGDIHVDPFLAVALAADLHPNRHQRDIAIDTLTETAHRLFARDLTISPSVALVWAAAIRAVAIVGAAGECGFDLDSCSEATLAAWLVERLDFEGDYASVLADQVLHLSGFLGERTEVA